MIQKTTFIIILVASLIFTVVSSQSTCKSESPKSVCSHPKPVIPNFKWFQDNQPEDGWHLELGNAAARLHLAEIIQGKLLTYDDDFSNMCGRVRMEHSRESIDGKLYGFDGKKAVYQCFPSKTEEPGATDCDFTNLGLNKYDDHSLNYFTLSDHKNLIIGIMCFPNGENGWFSMSKTTSLSEEERKTVLDHVTSVGYNSSDVVYMYSDSCTDKSVDASFFVRNQVRPIRRRFRNRQRNPYYRQEN